MIPYKEIPSGLVNGTNRAFFLSQLPISNMATNFYIDGVLQTEGVNFSLVGQRIYCAADSTPRVGNTVYATYWIAT